MSKDTSEPAFPLALGWIETDHGNGSQKVVDVRDVSHGMSLRDYFAGKALATLSAYPVEDVAHWDAADFAKHAYEVADAMLAARSQS